MYLIEQRITNDRRSSKSHIKKITDRWIRNYTTRRKLAELEDHILNDVGIEPAVAAQEARKPFWQD